MKGELLKSSSLFFYLLGDSLSAIGINGCKQLNQYQYEKTNQNHSMHCICGINGHLHLSLLWLIPLVITNQ